MESIFSELGVNLKKKKKKKKKNTKINGTNFLFHKMPSLTVINLKRFQITKLKEFSRQGLQINVILHKLEHMHFSEFSNSWVLKY